MGQEGISTFVKLIQVLGCLVYSAELVTDPLTNIASVRLEKTFKIIKSSQQPDLPSPITKPYSSMKC